MPANALGVDWNEVRQIALQVGVREAARRMGLPEETVKKRCTREGWIKEKNAIQAKVAQIEQLKRTDRGLSPEVPKAIEVLSAIGGETRLFLAKSALKVAKHVHKQPAAKLLQEAPNVKAWCQTAGMVHGFGSAEGVSLRLEIIAKGHAGAETIPEDAIDGAVEVERIADEDEL